MKTSEADEDEDEDEVVDKDEEGSH
jgi:hypothetical protein